MGFYQERVLPRMIDRMCGSSGMERWRSRTVEGLRGKVVEIGFGSGLNVPFYGEDVECVYAIEPSAAAMGISSNRVAASNVRVEHLGLDGQTLPLDDESCDGALCTFSLCTIPDPAAALREVRRVLRPGGRFHFLEHGAAPDPSVARWQRRIDPLESRLFDGCHLTRDPLSLVAQSGLVVVDLKQRYVKGPKPWCYFTMGHAVRP